MSAYRASRMLRMCLGGISEGPASVRHEARAPGHQFSLLSGGTPRLPALTLTSESDPPMVGHPQHSWVVRGSSPRWVAVRRQHHLRLIQVRFRPLGLEPSAPAACVRLL